MAMDIWHNKPLPQRPPPERLRQPRVSPLAKIIQEETNGGLDLVAFALLIFRGTITDTKWDRTDALQWLADRGFGKAPQQVQIEADVNIDMIIRRASQIRKNNVIDMEGNPVYMDGNPVQDASSPVLDASS